ncbi:MAG: homoserine acetyltransferase, partial [Pseudomonadota bacterium]|nr:homoserine acetyltransferase [Pseudomonadota bacterium]
MNWNNTLASTLVWNKSKGINKLLKQLSSQRVQKPLALANLVEVFLVKKQRSLVGLFATLMLTIHCQGIAGELEDTSSLLSSSKAPSSEAASSSPSASHSNAALMVEKRVFEMPHFTTFGGKQIKNVKVGWEAYGTLNDAKSNVILITHYFSGSS